MDAFEFNKFAGALLLALLVMFGARTASNIIFKVHKPAKPGFAVEIAAVPEPSAGQAADASAEIPLSALLAKASVQKGQGIARKCAQCHTFNKGGANKIGPNLYGVLGSALGAADGYAYSKALKAKGGSWDYGSLDQFIARPKDFIKGTKMTFAGIKKAEQRADLILYLRTLAGNPAALPAR